MKMVLFLFLILSCLPCNFAWSKSSEDPCKGVNHPAYQDEYRTCLRTQLAIKARASGVDCETCFYDQEEEGSSDLSQAIKVLTQPVLQVALQYAVTNFQTKMQERAANNYAAGFEACTNQFNKFLNMKTTIGANPISAADAQAYSSSCNGQSYGSYAGYGGLTSNGFGGFGNPFLTNGHSSNYMSAYNGPYAYASNSIYGNGMTAGAIGVSAYGGYNFNGQGSTSSSTNVYQNMTATPNGLTRTGF